ncbi:TonB-linked SusC/RagA family outer membrane protein [Chitinophaga niastensis]|uniref:TonB-linked SusC/RagA family outer membrane protein n=1 Tax=Chitinophaga niastensis TaxID=536980 RepID=A0A2P8HVM0_CHINA|nr:SusC/RagA family TonB-linked outer membrane protein [Chitinophaga niastensis]PSL50272.1 TonB-linked SusC/RagA family outer membrane protein [Chitinophaga niastensis]
MRVSASVYSQDVKVTLDIQNKSLSKALNELGKKSNLHFLFSEETLPAGKLISLSVKETSVMDVLQLMLANTSLSAKKMNDKLVVIVPMGTDIQDKRIKGKVSSAKGEALIGVTVKVEGTNIGAVTDGSGAYELNAPGVAKLVFTYVGFLSKTVAINNRDRVDISLEEDTRGLNEVVVVGYGTQKKVNLTGAISSISAKDIENVPVSNISNALAGRLSGLFANTPSGIPGVSSPITIRGKGTLNGNGALYVIDGVVRGKEDFDVLTPNEIESVSVLKDAASAAVYGARAANGVLLVTTRRGELDQAPRFSYSGNVGSLRPTSIPSRLNSYQHAIYQNDMLYNQFPGISPNDVRLYSPDELEYYKAGKVNTDWYKLVAKDPLSTQHTLSVNGGGKSVRYFMSLGYYNESGVFSNMDYKRYNLRSNVEANVTKNFTVSLNIDGNFQNSTRPYWPWDGDNAEMKDFYRGILNQPPMSPAYVNGLPDGSIYHWHAAEVIKNGGYLRKNYNTFNGQLALNYKLPVDGLSAVLSYNYNKKFNFTKTQYKSYTLYQHNTFGGHGHLIGDSIIGSTTAAQLPYNSLQENYNQPVMYLLNGGFKYNKAFGKHTVGALLLYEQSESYSDQFMAKGENPLSPSIDQLFVTDPDHKYQTVNGSGTQTARISYVGRVNYVYADKYLFEANFRSDASTQFGPQGRWGFFPSVSAGWRISEEPFMKGVVRGLDNLKLRASYGITGNDYYDDPNIPPYQWQSKYVVAPGAVFNGATMGLTNGVYPNPALTWEKAATTDIGVDASFWNGLLSVEADYFRKHTYDILWTRNLTVPGTFGATLPSENYAVVDNHGIELSLRHDNQIGQVKYYVGGNFSFARNKVINMAEPANAMDYQKRIGRPIDFVTGYIATGIARSDKDLQNLPDYNAPGQKFEVGDIIFKDISGPNGKPDGIVNDYDKVVLSNKSIHPEIIYGINGGVSWKGFDINFLFQGVANREVMFPNRDQWREQAVLSFWADHYTPENVNAAYPKIGGKNGTEGPASSFWLRNGAYFRLKFLELGYTLPKALLQKAKINNVRFYVSGSNLFTIAAIKLYDPEFETSYGAFQYPIMRSVNVGVNIGF